MTDGTNTLRKVQRCLPGDDHHRHVLGSTTKGRTDQEDTDGEEEGQLATKDVTSPSIPVKKLKQKTRSINIQVYLLR